MNLSEDAHFVKRISNITHVGVFVGVGSWRKLGVDPRLYPRALSEACEASIEDHPSLRPDEILERAWRKVTSSEIPGSSTALLLSVSRSQVAYCSLGDCGVVVLRKPDVAGTAAHTGISATRAPLPRSSTTVARFQLTVSARLDERGRDKPFEAPSNANVGTVPVFADDIIVMATDGLFDNVALETVAEVCDQWEHDKSTSRRSASARKRENVP